MSFGKGVNGAAEASRERIRYTTSQACLMGLSAALPGKAGMLVTVERTSFRARNREEEIPSQCLPITQLSDAHTDVRMPLPSFPDEQLVGDRSALRSARQLCSTPGARPPAPETGTAHKQP